MSVKIRLKRFGTKKKPYYRIVVMDTRKPRDGKTIEEVGYYHPIELEEKRVQLKEERIKAWLDEVSPTELRIVGILEAAIAVSALLVAFLR